MSSVGEESDHDGFETNVGKGMEMSNEVDVLKDGSLIKKIITPGSGWEKPKQHYELSLHLTGKHNDIPFDTTTTATPDTTTATPDNKPRTYTLGAKTLCKGVEETLKTMKKGEHARVVIPPQHAFGEAGWAEKGVPGGASVEYELELVSWMKVEDVRKDGGILVKTIRDGPEYVKPRDGDAVFLRYRGTVEEGDVTRAFA
eukprot:CAMPEP_0181316480 /NCGR_PEP_ID=MMETSP1101-20121128/15918_1 /TAXON_ID=46948 /ORGANISM="Rhodomonas abbreviata, Strain Caron Lab Isolate" /LENGTH=199 /DNA_ID=CAMNT_0023423731 /DNA_START=164 /DNA_END=760 /DNA_ORIENTATION=+